MDSAETRGLQELLAGNNARMDLQEENMLNTGRAVQALVAQVSELTTQVQLLKSPAAPPTPPSFSIPGNHSPQHEPRLPAPEMYAGDPNLCRAFLTKCSLFFSLQPLTFATEVSRVALVLTLLSGKAALWGTAVVAESPSLLFLVPLTLSGDEEGVRSRAGRARGSTHAGRPPPGGAVRF